MSGERRQVSLTPAWMGVVEALAAGDVRMGAARFRSMADAATSLIGPCGGTAAVKRDCLTHPKVPRLTTWTVESCVEGHSSLAYRAVRALGGLRPGLAASPDASGPDVIS